MSLTLPIENHIWPVYNIIHYVPGTDTNRLRIKKKKQKMYIIHTDIHNMDKNASSHSILLRYLSPFLILFSTKPDDYFSKFTNVFILSVNLLAQGIVFCSSWSSSLSLDWWKTKINPNLNNRFHSTELPGDPLPPEEH